MKTEIEIMKKIKQLYGSCKNINGDYKIVKLIHDSWVAALEWVLKDDV